MQPGDPQIGRVREKIKGTDDSAADTEITAGNEALSSSDFEEAQRRYERAEELGAPQHFVKLNLAMAAVGAGNYAAARKRLDEYSPRPHSPTELHTTALRTVCDIAERGDGKESKQQLEQLEEQKRRVSDKNGSPYDYIYTTSPLRHLEAGLAKSKPAVANQVASVFAVLKHQE